MLAVIFYSSNQLLPLSVKSISLSNTKNLAAWNKWWFLSKSCEVLITEVEKSVTGISGRSVTQTSVASLLSGMRKKSFHKKDLLKRRKCKLTSSFLNFLWVLWCSLSRQEAWKGCIQYKCFICKTICRAEERRKSSCKPQKKNLKENASEKSRFLQKCTFYCFSSLSLFAGINQSIIKPFPTTIESSTIKKSSKQGLVRTSSFLLSVIARLWHLLKKKQKSEMPRTSWWWLENSFWFKSGMQVWRVSSLERSYHTGGFQINFIIITISCPQSNFVQVITAKDSISVKCDLHFS